MTHLSAKHPYRGTRVSYARSKEDIQEMLVEAGAVGLNWEESIFSLKGEAMPNIAFMMRVIRKDNEIKFAVLIKPPMLMKKESNKYSKDVPDREASMRLLYWYLKARLEGVRFGLEDIFDAFMSRVITALPDGSISTLGETVMEHSEAISSILPEFEIKIKALPVKQETEQK